MKILNESFVKDIAYHGSQEDNLVLEDRPLYITSDKDMAIEFARGYCFGYDLFPEDTPTLYTIEFTMKNPRYIHTEDEYEEFMDIANVSKKEYEENGYDGAVYEPEDGVPYYMLLSGSKQARIVDKEYVGDDE